MSAQPTQFWPLRVVVMPESEGWSAGCIEFPGFLLLGEDRDDVLARLPAALNDHCGRTVEFEIVNSGGKAQ
jgi:hypothetical protein